MSGGAKTKGGTPPGKHAPARAHAPAAPARAAKPAAKPAGAAKPVAAARPAATQSAKTPTRALPIRSSPAGTTQSLRSKLTSLKTPAKSPARASAPSPAKAKTPPFARNPVLQELEPRLLMSADLNPLSGDALLSSPSLAGAEFRNIADTGTPTVVTTGAVAPIQRTHELVFVDTQTPEYEKLVEAMREAAAAQGRNLEFVLIDADKDGIRKITDTLAQKSDLDAIHVISHARDGAVQLGSAQLDFDTLFKRAAAVKKWGEALTENGDILFYGCDLAATSQGQSLMQAVARLTGADVAASEDPTGAAAKGGDWDLEFKTGAIEAPVLVSLPAQREWDHLLVVYTVNVTTDTNPGGGGVGAGTTGDLRWVIGQSNASGAVDDVINFNIGGGGVQTITLADRIDITDNVVIDGTTQPGYAGSPLIGITDVGAGSYDGFRITGAAATGTTIRGLAIFGFGGDGIDIRTADSNIIVGNYIGITQAGVASANDIGINITNTNDSDNNTIGGAAAADRNVISGNTTYGISINASAVGGATGNRIENNYIGVNPAGTAALLNVGDGIRLASGAASTTIVNNVIGVGDDGIELTDSDNNVIQGNSIGTDPTGTLNFAGGASSDGVNLKIDSDGNTIGGTVAGQGNLIANVLGAGVNLEGAGGDQNRIRGNGIWNNTAGGILLAGHTQEAYGAFDPDAAAAANEGQNYPTFLSFPATVAVVGGDLQISNIRLSSTANSTYAIDFFASPAAGSLQGKRYLGSVTGIVTNAAGTVTFNATLTDVALLAGERITATATATASGTATEIGNTSPFSSLTAGNFMTVPLAGTGSLSGRVYEDVNGDGSVAEDVRVNAGVTVRLYADNGDGAPGAGDLLITSTTTNAAGDYTFTGLTDGTYWVAIDSRQITPNAGVSVANTAWAEQTYGDAEAWTGAGVLGADGAFYGGKSVNVSDNAPAGLLFSEHILRGTINGAANVTGRDAGFSFVAITNARGDNTDDDTGSARTQQGSLRQFIQNSNVINGVQAADFSIGAAGSAQSITLTGAELATITDAVTLDAWTQGAPGYNGVPLIELNGNALGAGADGLTVTATNGTTLLRGFVINRFTDNGILLNGATGVTIQGSYVGTNAAGNAASSNNRDGGISADGIRLINANSNTIGGLGTGERNVISGNDTGNLAGAWERGVYLWNSDNNVILGNYIGTNAAGTAALRNYAEGITIEGDAGGGFSNGNVIRNNLISGNKEYGILVLSAGSTGQIIQGNLIGTNFDGTTAIANGSGTAAAGDEVDGIRLDSANNTIGGTNASDRNVISGNARHGIYLNGDAADGNLIRGNYIGTAADGTAALGNASHGIRLNNADSNTIGGSTISARNVIAGNASDGINIQNTANNNVIQRNWIGQNAAGSALGNGNDGIELGTGSANNLIGGTGTGDGNVIRANLDAGVELRDAATDGNRILGNSIYSNAALGIDLEGPDQLAGDPDTGPNQGQNYPVIATVTNTGTALRLQGSLTTDPGAATYRLEFFLSNAGDPEGQTFLGATNVTTAGGVAAYDVTFAVAAAVGQLVTATATDAAGNTSQFSVAAAVPAAGGAGNTISGIVYEDVNGDSSLADGIGAEGVTVRLFLDNGNGALDAIGVDTLARTAVTDAAGNYTFTGLTNGARYWVAVDSRTINPSNALNAGSLPGDVWADQTYGDDWTTSALDLGSRFSGRNGATSDNAVAANTAEHVARRDVPAGGGSIAGVNFGFSFNVVTNTLGGDAQDDDGANNRTVQGSLRQFIQNANAIAGANTMRFVPAAGPNVVTGVFSDDGDYTNDGGDDWWRITVTTGQQLPTITTQTTIDGTAYSRFDGTSLANTNQGVVGYTGAVGLGADGIAGTGDDPAALTGTAKPELEIREEIVGDVDIGLDVQASNVTIRAISIHGFGTPGDIFSDGDIVIGRNLGGDVGLNFTGILIEDSVIGSGPAALADPTDRSVNGIGVFGADGGTIRRNAIAYAGHFGIFLTNDADGWTVTRNDIRANGQDDSGRDGIDIGNLSGGATVTQNYFFQNRGSGIDGYRGAGGNLIEDNTVAGNGAGGTETAGIRLYGTGSTVRQNVITLSGTFASPGAGVLVVRNDGATNSPATGNLISRNSFNGTNWSNAIDLNAAAGNNNLGDGITLNDGGTNVAAGNLGIDYPVITSAGKSGATTTISGTAAAGVTSVEVYRAFAGAGDSSGGNDYGEGNQYLGTATVVAGSWTLNFTDGAVTLNVGEAVSAIGITAANDTSEFGANFTVTAVTAISGTIYHDVNANGDVTDDGGAVFASVANAVRLYIDSDNDGQLDAGDAFIASANTDASGNYTFLVTPGPITRYWVTVDSRALNTNTNTWAEQTYAVAGAANNAAGTTFTLSAGALYGGRNAQTSDVATTALNSEHVIRADISGGSVTGVNAGFSYNVITSTRDVDDDPLNPRTAQGTYRQFLLNSNAVAGTQSSVFRLQANDPNHLYYADNGAAGFAAPTVTTAANDGLILDFDADYLAGTARSWWRIQPTLGALPALTDVTIIDATTQAGYDPAKGPIVELDGVSGANFGVQIDGAGGGSTVRGLVINRFNDGVFINNSSGNRVEGSYIGTDVSGTVARANADDGIDIADTLAIPGGAANNTIGGTTAAQRNVVSGNAFDGIVIGDQAGATGNLIIGNYIGTNAAGRNDLGNGANGVLIRNAATANTVGGTTAAERNVIAGNNADGVHVASTAGANNVVRGNYIGVDVTGNTAVANTSNGVEVAASQTIVEGSIGGARQVISGNAQDGLLVSGGSNAIVRGNIVGLGADGSTILANGVGVAFSGGIVVTGATGTTIGATALDQRNVVSGNYEYGIRLNGTNLRVIGNYVGTDVTGLLARGNGTLGIHTNGVTGTTIGGAIAAERNLVSGNLGNGINIQNGADTVVQGNWVGLDATGGALLGNAGSGISTSPQAAATTIRILDNVVSGNGGGAGTTGGIWINGTDGVTVQGNLVGFDATGTVILGNTGSGIDLTQFSTAQTSDNNLIGGTVPGQGNRIAGSTQDGVRVTLGAGNRVLGNSIHSNGGLGINLQGGAGETAAGVTPNDANDGDAGANALQNFPVLTGGSYDGTTLTVSGTLNSTPSTNNYRIEFFASSAADPSGHGEGARYLGAVTGVNTDAAGNASFTFLQAVALNPGEVITATATSPTNNTSEFSAALYSVQGTIYEDDEGDGSLAGDLGRNGVTVRLYADNTSGGTANQPDATDALVATGTTYGGGNYWLFAPGLTTAAATRTSFVTVDSRTITPGAGYTASGYVGVAAADDVWAEQTYGAIGAMNGAASYLGAAGILYGGKSAAAADDAAALATSEHVTRIVLGTAGASGLDSGFSFSAIVDTRGDDTDFDLANDRVQQGTLRQFVRNANAIAGVQTSNFSINYPAGGPQTITLSGAGAVLDVVNDAVVLDATTQEGWTLAPIITLNGGGLAGNGFRLASNGSTVRGFVIQNFGVNGVRIIGNDNVVAGNYIGTNAAGTAAVSNGADGVLVDVGFSNNTIGGTAARDRNVISGNLDDGVSIDGASGTVVINNYIGVNWDGTALISNGGDGVAIQAIAGTGATNNTIGGTGPNERNVIAGNATNLANGVANVHITGVGTSNNVVLGNYIGTNAAGSAALANLRSGVVIEASATNNTIGGTAAAAMNLISGHNNGVYGVVIKDAGTSGNQVMGNRIGTNAAGLAALPNNLGVYVYNGATANTIGGSVAGAGNLVSGNATNGIRIEDDATDDNVIQGNWIGVDATGNVDLGNGDDGIEVVNADGTRIGGTTALARNVVSGSDSDQIEIRGSADGTVVEGNYVGLNAGGTAAIGNIGGTDNDRHGIRINVTGGVPVNTTIGGAAAGAGNVVSGNDTDGIFVTGAGITGTLIQANYIGTDYTGTADLGNHDDGIDIDTDAGPVRVLGNVISGNDDNGLRITNNVDDGVIRGNLIGTAADGTTALGNATNGIWFEGTGVATSSPTNWTVGGIGAGEANVIAFNGQDGVTLSNSGASQISIRGNSIHSNGQLGIDLGDDGVTLNDGTDLDPGANTLLNYPVLSTALTTGASITISGSLTSQGPATYQLDFYSNPAAEPGPNGEGRTYLGSMSLPLPAAGAQTVAFTTPAFAAVVPVGAKITATATDASGNTSEFALNLDAAVARTISGTVFHDVDGDADVAEGGTLAVSGATVHIFRDTGGAGAGTPDATDVWVSTTTTDASGVYTFTVPDLNTYWVVVDSKTINAAAYNGGFGLADVWAEQTYGDNSATAAVDLDARYGGRNATVSDDATAAPASLATAEHVARVDLSGANVSGIDYGFSFNVVTNVRGDNADDDGGGTGRHSQGTLDQFILNANAIQSSAVNPNAMRFVPAVAANQTAGADSWWRITLASALPQITDQYTVIDGTAYQAAVNGAVRDTNTGVLGAGGTVGVDGLALGQVARPELEIVDGAAANVIDYGFDVTGANVTIRDLAIYGFGDSGINLTGNIRITGAGATGALIEGNVIGSGAAAFADPGAAARGERHGIVLDAADGTTVRGNLIGFASFSGLQILNGADAWLIEGNEIRGTGLANNIFDGVSVLGSNGGTVRGNLITASTGPGIDAVTGAANVTIVNNTLSGNSSIAANERFGIEFFNPGVGNVVDRNIITGNTGPGILVSTSVANTNVNAGYVRITRNSISGNSGLGIDLDNTTGAPRDGDGVTANDGADADNGPNNLFNRPTLTSASYSGGNLTVVGSYQGLANQQVRIEFFASTAADPTGSGEGQRFLGVLDFTTDATGAYSINHTFAAAITPGEVITATATRSNLGFGSFFETSEFSNAVGTATITGTIYHDVNGDSSLGGDAGYDGVTVRLYRDDGDGVIDAGDTFVGSATTSGGGLYGFGSLATGTYWVSVDSRTFGAGLWAEQTYGVAGSQTATGELAVAGANYGGRSATSSDDAAAGLTSADHVTRATIAGANVSGVNSGFSFNVVTNVRGDATDDDLGDARWQQGSLNQFIRNANTIAGPNAMRFVPAVNPNQVTGVLGGGDDWWRITLAAALPQITGADTTIDGTAYSSADGVTALDATNAGSLGTGGTVGVGALALSTVARPELEIVDGAGLARGFDVNAANATIRDLAAYGFDVNVYVGNVSGTTITGNVLGAGAASFADPGAAARTNEQSINVDLGDNGTITNNLIGFSEDSAVRLAGGTDTWTISNNEIRGAGQVDTADDGVDLDQNASNILVSGNLIAGNRSPGVHAWQNAVNVTVTNNTITGNATGAAGDIFGVGFDNPGAGNVVSLNVISGNNGPGVMVREGVGGVAVPGGYVRITQNSISGNVDPGATASGLGIDLGGTAVLNGDGVTANDGAGDGDSGPNALQNFPVLTGVATDGTNVTINGTVNVATGGSFRLEFFANAVPAPGADPTGHGEGQRYIGSLDVTDGGAGDLDGLANGVVSFATTLAPAGGVAAGEIVTATATRANAGFGAFFETSEFAQNFTATAARSISGTVYHDVNADAAVSGVEGAFAGATVRLYLDDGDGNIDAGDTFVAATATDASGNYGFSGLTASRYWVVVDSKTLTLAAAGFNNFATDADDVWAEQTYAVFGARQGFAGVTGVSGALYGGRFVNVSDDGSLLNGEHVIGRDLVAGNATSVDYGFSFNAIVNDRGDATDDDGVGGTDRLQQGTLRQFILNSNALAGVQSSNFSINYAGGGAQTIAPTAAQLPDLTDAVVLDATTQEGAFAVGAPRIELDGSGLGAGADGLRIVGASASGSTIRGFAINRFSDDGIVINDSSGNVVAGNYIGTNFAGSAAAANGESGIEVNGATSANNTIGGTAAGDRNVISGNALFGVSVFAATGTRILGNYIGLDATGASALPNGSHGLDFFGASGSFIGDGTAAGRNVISGNGQTGVNVSGGSANQILGNYIGTNAAGTVAVANGNRGVEISGSTNNVVGAAGAGNLISGNTFEGLVLSGASTGNTIQGNRIGTNAAGTAALGNTNYGVLLGAGANDNTIGGTAAGAGNLISGNTAATGLDIQSTGNVVLGNRIGTDAAGAADLGNNGPGIRIRAANNTVGGTAAGATNVVSGNSGGVFLQGAGATGNVIQGNYIGVAADGSSPLGNDFQGVVVANNAANNTIGGTGAGEGNIIANSLGSSGITVFSDAGSGNRILRNSIYDNFGRGINLQGGTENAFGVTANDAGDGDGGANNLQNYPVLASAVSTSTQVTIAGSLDSITGATFRLEFFANTAADPSGHGEGERYLGFVTLTDGGPGDLDGLANGVITFSTTLVASVTPGEFLSATATNLGTGDTSEFAANITIVAAQVSITASDPTAGEPANNGQFTVTLSGPSATDTVIAYSIGGTATPGAGNDYTTLSGTVTIVAGTLSATIDVTVLDDLLLESSETVVVTLSSISSGDGAITVNGAANQATVTIADNETATVTLSANDAAAAEAGSDPGQFTVDLGTINNTGAAIVVNYTVTGSATGGADYTALTGSVSIAAGAQTAVINVAGIVDDALLEGAETVTVQLTSTGTAGVGVDATARTVTIADNETATADLAVTTNGNETGPVDIVFTVTLSTVNTTGAAITFDLARIGGTATSGLDFTAIPGGAQVLIANGATTGTYTVTVADDALAEALETLQVQIANPSLASVAIGTGSATATITDNDLSLSPSLVNNAWTIADGGTLAVTLANLSATDPDTPAGTLVFTVGGVTNGYFEYAASPGVPVTTFTQQQITNGEVRFVHNGSGAPPSFTIYVWDGTSGAGPVLANITFVGGGGTSVTPPPPPPGGGPGPVITPPPVPGPATGAVPSSVPGATSFLRGPSEPPIAGGEEDAAAGTVSAAARVGSVEKRLVADMGLPSIRVEPEVIETKPQRSELEVEPIRAEMQVLPVRRDALDNPEDEERRTIEVILSSVRITGLAFSVGAVWWAARAAGLIASLLASSPAWRHVDPLPVLGRDEEDEEEDLVEEDQDRKDDEHRAGWVLEERG